MFHVKQEFDPLPTAVDDWSEEVDTAVSLPGQPVPHPIKDAFAMVRPTRVVDISEIVEITWDTAAWEIESAEMVFYGVPVSE